MSRYRIAALLALLIAFPLAANHWDQSFYVSFASRILIYAIAATSLNLILGYGGMISFGHAAYLGAGAYTVGILMQEGVASAWIAWPAAIVTAGLSAAIIGAICLRTRGVYFIMITLAFAQMMYYVFVSLRSYGGEDGFTLARRSTTGLGLDLKNDLTFYYIVLALLICAIVLMRRLTQARFGGVLDGIRENRANIFTHPDHEDELRGLFYEILADYRDYPKDPGYDQRVAFEKFRRDNFAETRRKAGEI